MFTSTVQHQTAYPSTNLTRVNPEKTESREQNQEEYSHYASELKNLSNPSDEQNNDHNVDHKIGNISILSTTGNLIQPKLKINSPGDKYEKEADQVANQVMRMEAPTIQRKCSKCDDEGQIQTKSNHSTSASSLTSPELSAKIQSSRGKGQAITNGPRIFMESRFGHDFRQVRVHADSEAAKFNQSINSRAFTIGQDIYFNRGEYTPHSRKGKTLLAHELVHTIQQSSSNPLHKSGSSNTKIPGQVNSLNSSPFQILRKEDTAANTSPTPPENSCLPHTQKIIPIVEKGVNWLNQTISSLEAFISAPNDKANSNTSTSLQRHFHSTEVSRVQVIIARLRTIRANLSQQKPEDRDPLDPQPRNLKLECPPQEAYRNCDSGGAFTTGADRSRIILCPGFLSRPSIESQATTLIHENVHTILYPGGRNITDRAYDSNRRYSQLSPDEALDNADSYAELVREIGSGKIQPSQAPSDQIEDDCPTDTQTLAREVMGWVERWNYRSLTNISRENNLLDTHIGNHKKATKEKIRKVYRKTWKRLMKPVDIKCDDEKKNGALAYYREGKNLIGSLAGIGAVAGGLLGLAFGGGIGGLIGGLVGAVVGGIVGGLASSKGAIHLSPGWKDQSEEERGKSLLAAIYQMEGVSSSDASKYAALAHAIHKKRFKQAPVHDERDVMRIRLQQVRQRLTTLRKLQDASSDAFSDSLMKERLRDSDKNFGQKMLSQSRSDRAKKFLWGDFVVVERIQRTVRVVQQGMKITLKTPIQLKYEALSDQEAQKQAATDIPRLVSTIREIWKVKITSGEYEGVDFSLDPIFTLLPSTKKRNDNAFLLVIRGQDNDPSDGQSTTGVISLAKRHMDGARIKVVAHELAHLFGFTDRYLKQTKTINGKEEDVLVFAGMGKTENKADLLGMIDPVVLERARKQKGITPEDEKRQSGPVHIWEREASLILRALGVFPSTNHREPLSPESEHFDPELELGKIRGEKEEELSRLREARKRTEDSIKSVERAKEIIDLEKEEKALMESLKSNP